MLSSLLLFEVHIIVSISKFIVEAFRGRLICIIFPTIPNQLSEFGVLNPLLIQPTIIFDSVHNHYFVHVLERNTAAHYLPSHGSNCVHIGTLGLVLLLDQFWRHVVHSPTLVKTVSVVNFVAQPEVAYLDFTSFTYQNIMAFNVFMNLAVEMYKFDGKCDFEKNILKCLAFLLSFIYVYTFVKTHIHKFKE